MARRPAPLESRPGSPQGSHQGLQGACLQPGPQPTAAPKLGATAKGAHVLICRGHALASTLHALKAGSGTRPKAGWGTWLPSEELTRALSRSAGSRRPEPHDGPPPGVSGAACDWRTQHDRAAGGGRRLSQGHCGGRLVGLWGGSSALLPHWKHGGPACSSWDPRMLISEGLRPFHSE